METEIKESCSNCINMVGQLGSPNSDRIICGASESVLDGWPHRDYRCNLYEKETRQFTLEKRNCGLLLPCNYKYVKVVLTEANRENLSRE